MKLLEARHVAHHFDYPLFSDVDLTLSPHESVAIVGASGSGKSTLLHILSTLLKPDEGEVELFGQEIYALKNRKMVQLRRDDIGMIFQQHYLFRGFTGTENLEVAAMLSDEEIDGKLLRSLGIDTVIGQKVTELSGGQQQRVSIARVLIKKPKVIFADEPTGNLDSETAAEVMNLFEDYIATQEAGLILVTHETSLAMRCQRVYRLEGQKLERIK